MTEGKYRGARLHGPTRATVLEKTVNANVRKLAGRRYAELAADDLDTAPEADADQRALAEIATSRRPFGVRYNAVMLAEPAGLALIVRSGVHPLHLADGPGGADSEEAVRGISLTWSAHTALEFSGAGEPLRWIRIGDDGVVHRHLHSGRFVAVADRNFELVTSDPLRTEADAWRLLDCVAAMGQ